MSVSEFDLIRRFFAGRGCRRADVVLGIGDDCALLRCPLEQELAVSIDTLVEGVHFLASDDPRSVGHKALAVGLSDLAAAGAQPAWATLALTVPDTSTQRVAWVEAFAEGFLSLAAKWDTALVGGDTTRGPLAVTVQVHGFAPAAQVHRRSGASAGDLIYVTGTLGDAGLALLARQGQYVAPEYGPELRRRLHWPQPRIQEGKALRGLASAAIDISDGLSADLGHVLLASGVGATVDLERLPLSPPVREYVEGSGDWSLPLGAGDVYELCFCLPPARQVEAELVLRQAGADFTWIGVVEAHSGLRCRNSQGDLQDMAAVGWDHFA